MLKFMENEQEIFRVWLKKFVKDDKNIKGNELAEKLKISQPTLTGYHSGRVIDGERKFPAIPFNIREKILQITGVSFADMMETGRASSHDPPGNAKEQLTKETSTDNVIHFKSAMERKHFEVIKTFDNQEKAMQVNSLLSELEKLDIEAYYSLAGMIEGKVNKLRQTEKGRSAGKAWGEEQKNA